MRARPDAIAPYPLRHPRGATRRRIFAAAAILALFASVAPVARAPLASVVQAAGGLTARISTDSSGAQGNGASEYPIASGNGQYVVFDSFASNLAPGDTNGFSDIFLRDRGAGTVTLASVAQSGGPADGPSRRPTVSDDGRYVAFESSATNLVAGDTNGSVDVFVRDVQLSMTIRASVDAAGVQGDRGSTLGIVSADGVLVAFSSFATNLVVPDATPRSTDVFVRDLAAGTIERVSVSSSGTQANAGSSLNAVSADGRFIAFSSGATNLVGSDTNAVADVFVHDRLLDATTRESVDSSGGQSNGTSAVPTISGDGRYVAFESSASNLVADDTNGQFDVFLHDRLTGATSILSVDTDGTHGNLASYLPVISRDGQVVAFESRATNLVIGDTNDRRDIFVRHLVDGITTRESVDSNGAQGNDDSETASLSGDGSVLLFMSRASNLVESDTNFSGDAFVRELGPQPTGLTELIYVHGITSSYLNSRFAGLLDELSLQFPNRVRAFEYYQDTGSDNCSPPVTLPAEPNGGMPVDLGSIDDNVCDSQSDLALDTVRLGELVAARYAATGRKVVLIGHSMGATIIRGLLAYSAERGDGVAEMIDSATFIEGAQDGSQVLAGLVNLSHEENPFAKGVGDLILGGFSPPIDPARPAVTGLAPKSDWYEWANPPADHLPALPYFNVLGDIRVTHEKCTWWWCADEPGVLLEIGDGGIVPGTDDPFDVAPKGGARMLRDGALGAQNWQWSLRADVEWTWWNDPLFANAFAKAFARPENHRNLPDQLADVLVPDCKNPAEIVGLDTALLRVIRGRMNQQPYECTP